MNGTQSPGAKSVELHQVSNVWELNPDQLEQVYGRCHMNNYVHAALITVNTGKWPRHRTLKVVPGKFSTEMEEAVNSLLRFASQLTAPRDPRAMRIKLALALYRFYRTLPDEADALASLSDLMQLMAGLAFLPLVAEKNDRFPLWWHPPVRPLKEIRRRELAVILKGFRHEDLIDFYGEKISQYCKEPDRPISLLFSLTIRLVSTIIIMMENGVFPEIALTAFRKVEEAMLDIEYRHQLGNRPGMALNIEGINQIRYRNTLYLYGGNLLERMGRIEEAREWYLKDIDNPDLPGHLDFYLTALKTCERLLCAYRTLGGAEDGKLLALLNRSLARSLEKTRDYGRKVLDIVEHRPELDLSLPKIQLGAKQILFSGEANREPLLAALLYQRMVKGIPYSETDYSLFKPDV